MGKSVAIRHGELPQILTIPNSSAYRKDSSPSTPQPPCIQSQSGFLLAGLCKLAVNLGKTVYTRYEVSSEAKEQKESLIILFCTRHYTILDVSENTKMSNTWPMLVR